VKNWDTLVFLPQAHMQWASNIARNVPSILMPKEYGARAAIEGSGTEKVAEKELGNVRHLFQRAR
jgi:hypothetical protein